MKVNEQDEAAKKRIADLIRATANLKASLNRYYGAFAARGQASAALHNAFGELYPGGQPFTANLTTLIQQAPLWAETKDEVEAMKAGVDQAIKDLDAKLAALAKQCQDRINLRIDIAQHEADIAGFEAKGAPAATQLDQSRAKLKVSEAAFKDIESVLEPELARLDGDIAALTSAAFRQFTEAQVAYNTKVAAAYDGSLSAGAAVPADAGEPAPAPAPAPEPDPEAAAAPVEVAPAAEAVAAPAVEAAPSSEAPAAAFDPFAGAPGEAAPAQ